MTRRASRSKIDQLISESKQVTTDLLALRHELERPHPDAVFGCWRNRADLLYDNLHHMSDELFAMRFPKTEIESEDDSDFSIPKLKSRALGNGQLRLTAGGR